MATITLTLRQAFKLAVRNPDDEGQVYLQSGASANTYANVESATFSEAVATGSQIGSTGFYEASVSVPDASAVYPITVWASTATAFSDVESFEGVWSPKNEPANVTQFGGTGGTFGGGIPSVNTTQFAGEANDVSRLGTFLEDYENEALDCSIAGSVGSISGVNFPTNFSTLGIDASGHISRVTLVDTTTTNTDMRGTDGAYTGTPPTASAIADQVWDEATSGHATAGTFGAYVAAIFGLVAKFSGITSLASWLGLIAGKTADTVTRAEINATTAGAGYNETTDSQEAIRDRGDAAWAGSGDASEATLLLVKAQTDKITTSQINVVSPYSNGQVLLNQGDTYSSAAGQVIELPEPAGALWPDLSGWTLTFKASKAADNPESGTATISATTVTASGTSPNRTLTVSLTASQTNVATGLWDFEIEATHVTHGTNSLISGAMLVKPNITAS